jgi:glycosyltransferase involved in cell wall biosynthesis
VLGCYTHADLFVLSSRIARDGDRDGLPNVLMEAQSQGLACVATRVSAIPELLEDRGNGLLADAGDVQALAEAMLRLIRDPAERRRLGATGRERVRREFCFDEGIDRLQARLAGAGQAGS